MPKIQKFRFLELVVVVGLLLVLLWGLAEMLQRAQARGTAGSCSINLRMLSSPGTLYANDNAGSLPGPQPWGPAIPEVSWDKLIARQMGVVISPADLLAGPTRFGRSDPAWKMLYIFSCPEDPDQSAAGFTARSYSENLGDGLAATGIEPTADKIPSSKVVSAAGTVFLMENQAGATAFGAANAGNDTWIDLNLPDTAYEANLHSSNQILFPYFTVHFSDSERIVYTKKHNYYYRKRKLPYAHVLMHDGHVESYKNQKEAWESNTLPYYK